MTVDSQLSPSTHQEEPWEYLPTIIRQRTILISQNPPCNNLQHMNSWKTFGYWSGKMSSRTKIIELWNNLREHFSKFTTRCLTTGIAHVQFQNERRGYHYDITLHNSTTMKIFRELRVCKNKVCISYTRWRMTTRREEMEELCKENRRLLCRPFDISWLSSHEWESRQHEHKVDNPHPQSGCHILWSK